MAQYKILNREIRAQLYYCCFIHYNMSSLIDITRDSDILSRLFALHSTNSIQNPLGYSTLKNYVDWFKKLPNLEHTKIYTYGNWLESGLYLIVDRYHLTFNAIKSNDSELCAALKLLDWRCGYKIYAVPQLEYELVLKILNELRVPYRIAKLFTYKLPCNEALKWQIACPADYELITLTAGDADLVDSLWPPRMPGSIHFIRRIIDLNVSVALRNRHNGKLVAWCTRCQVGLLGSLQVIDECRRKGLATYITCQYAQKIAALGEDVWVSMNENNHAAIACFEKWKFIQQGTIYHIRAFSVPDDQVWTKN